MDALFLKHWGWVKMAPISQTTYSNVFSSYILNPPTPLLSLETYMNVSKYCSDFWKTHTRKLKRLEFLFLWIFNYDESQSSWYGNGITSVNDFFLSLAVPAVVKMINSNSASAKTFIKMMTFSFQCSNFLREFICAYIHTHTCICTTVWVWHILKKVSEALCAPFTYWWVKRYNIWKRCCSECVNKCIHFDTLVHYSYHAVPLYCWLSPGNQHPMIPGWLAAP